MARVPEPTNTFGGAVKRGLGYGALAGAALSADGNPLVGAALGAGIGAVTAGTRNIVQSVKYGNQRARLTKRIEANRHSALNSNQFDK